MNQYCVDLNLDIPVLKAGIDLTIFTKQYQTRLNVDDYINDDLKLFLRKFGINNPGAEVFYSAPNAFTHIHIDGAPRDVAKLNWAFGGKNSTMNWYTPKNGISKPVKISEHNTAYVGFMPSEVDLVYSCALGAPSIVQVGVPHNATNYDEHRWCVCILPFFDDRSQPTMQHMLDLFSAYIR